MAKQSDVMLYGMTHTGGGGRYGVAFSLTTSGTYSILKHLDDNIGAKPSIGTVLTEVGTVTSITTSTISPAAYCARSSLQVPFTVVGSYGSGNVFTAQLSDASGDFTTATNIGSVDATRSGTIDATIPASTAAGVGYRIRVVSSNPAVIGSNNGSDIAIIALSTYYVRITKGLKLP